MGTYYFTCATTGDVARVEYTFGYKRNDDGKARIFLHHSSVPYAPSGAVLRCDDDEQVCEVIEMPPITSEDVQRCQANWADAIQTISKTYLNGGDYIQAAGDAAGELYGYGHMDVLFKPTKATTNPFRPTPEVAMSYFVGADAMGAEELKGEDAGFAINGGKGWSKVVFGDSRAAHAVHRDPCAFGAQGTTQIAALCVLQTITRRTTLAMWPSRWARTTSRARPPAT